MSKSVSGKAATKSQRSVTMVVRQSPEDSDGEALARTILDPVVRNACAASAFAGNLLGKSIEPPALEDYTRHLQGGAAKAAKGDLAAVSRTLFAQAITLDAMYTEYARRAALNLGEYMDASERYSRLAMKAQANCRATLEALAQLHQPREQTVRHVQVNEGGQAIVADAFHHHGGTVKTGVSNEQSHAPRNDGETPGRAALSRSNAEGDGLPIPGGEREAALQDARRD